jgi:hypothetical protein
MLWSEAASENQARAGTENTGVTVGRFQQGIFSQIRRFAVVAVKRGFVYAWLVLPRTCSPATMSDHTTSPIFTYSRRGTTKPGCNAAEHSVVYLSGAQPVYIEGEIEDGLRKEPIEIQPADATIYMEPTSRLRFGKTYPVEMNVKVKDIGRVVPHHMSKFIRYWKDEDRLPDDEDEDDGEDTPQAMQTPRPTHGSPVQGTEGYSMHAASAYYSAQPAAPYAGSAYTQGDAQQSVQQNAGYPTQSGHAYRILANPNDHSQGTFAYGNPVDPRQGFQSHSGVQYGYPSSENPTYPTQYHRN